MRSRLVVVSSLLVAAWIAACGGSDSTPETAAQTVLVVQYFVQLQVVLVCRLAQREVLREVFQALLLLAYTRRSFRRKSIKARSPGRVLPGNPAR